MGYGVSLGSADGILQLVLRLFLDVMARKHC